MRAASSAVHPSRTPVPGRYRLDPARTTVRFRARHMFGLGVVNGKFELRGGQVHIAESIAASTIDAVMNADSIDTGHPTRDRMVRSRTYLDAGTYPDLHFVGDGVQTAGDRWIVHGTLDAHGVPVPFQITVHSVNAAADQVTFHASAQVDRRAHGITAGWGIAGRRLTIDIAAVATLE